MPASDHRATEQKKLPGIFISYRRSDSPDAVGRIYDRLIAEFGKTRVFKDVDSIPLGQDFRSHLNDIVGNCAAVLAVIGPRWVDTRNEAGQRRLEDPDDFVRIELEAALSRSVPVVPVLVGHAPMPGTSQLPSTLSSLAFRQSIEVRPDPDFHNDATRLVSALWAIVDPNAPREVVRVTSPHKSQASQWFAWGLAAVATLAAIAFAIPAWKYLRAVTPTETRVDIVTPATENPDAFALSPDGKQIVFVARSEGASRLWLRSLAKATAQPLAGTEGAVTPPFWSPDSRSIGFFTGSELKRLDLVGGTPQTLAPAVGFAGGSWSSKGVILFASSVVGTFSRIAATGGAITALPMLGKDAVSNVVPLFLPDGQHFVFLKLGPSDPGIYLGSLGGTAVQLTNETSRLAYLPSGWLLRIRVGGTLVAQRLDVTKGALVGEPVTLADGVLNISASATGLVAYRTGGVGQRQLTWVGRSGSVQGTAGAPDETIASPRVSPDGQRIAFSHVTQGKEDIWLLDGARASRVTFGSVSSTYPVWSPDGSRLAFQSGRGPTAGFFQKLANGAQAQEPLLLSDKIQFPSSWSADGRYLLYFGIDPGPSVDLWVLPTTGDRKSFSFLKSPSIKAWGQFSPDGRWVAYHSNESGPFEVYVRRFIAPGDSSINQSAQAGQWQVSTAGGAFPTWRADGKELFYIDPAGMMTAAPITDTGSTVEPGTPIALFKSNISGGGIDNAQGRQYDVARDGRFLINRVLDSAVAPITLIQNWNPDAAK